MIAVTGGGRDSNGVGVGGTNTRNQGAKINAEFADGKTELGKGVVDILKARLDRIIGGVIWTWGILTNSVGEGIVGRGFFTGVDVEISPSDYVACRGETLGLDNSNRD